MTPNEIYALPTISSDPWYKADCEIINAVFDIGYHSDVDASKFAGEQASLQVHLKLQHMVEEEHWVSLYSLEFDGKPFAMFFGGGNTKEFITDKATYERARDEVLTGVYLQTVKLTDGDANAVFGHHGAALARFADGVRFVNIERLSDKHFIPLVDDKKFEDLFDFTFAPVKDREEYKHGLNSDATRNLAAAILVGLIPSKDTAVVNQRSIENGFNLVFAVVDGETYNYSVKMQPAHRLFNWTGELEVTKVGPASFMENIRASLAGKKVEIDTPLARDLISHFSLSEEEAANAIQSVIKGTARQLMNAVISVVQSREEIPTAFKGSDHMMVAMRLVAELPGSERFGLAGAPSVAYAKKYIADYDEIRRRRAEAAAKDRQEQAESSETSVKL